jgi:hypothetical protein
MHTIRTAAIIGAAISIAAMAASSSYATIIHDEGINGDLSNNRFSPTPHTLVNGTNSLLATTGPGTDLEYVTLSVPAGLHLDSIVLVSYAGDDGTGFIGVQQGTTFTEPPNSPNPNNLLGWTHFGPDSGNLGTNILDDMCAAIPAIGCTPPLGPGPYTYWIQQLGSPMTYQLDFNVSPEPATFALLSLGIVAIRLRRR